jgi:predicted NBD/HSP70 family sugar kinase
VGRVLASACGLLDPECVIIGGELAPAGKPLLDNIRRSLDRWISPAAGHKYPVQAGELGAKAEVLGAIALAMSHVPEQTLDPGSSAATDPGRG